VAKKLGKTDRAVHMLCNRGLKRLREHMGSASRYLSSG
jgi:DNA-directed RNA polymerase specialized sigma24 family protein